MRPIFPLVRFGISCQQRNASILSSLSNVKSSYSHPKRVGRGPSSGKGKTSGRGHKGQKQHGKVPAGFTGGQTPDHIVHGERGFVNHFSSKFSKVNLDKIQYWIDKGRLDPSKVITVRELVKSRCIHGIQRDGVKLLAGGKEELRSPVNIVVGRASAEAIAAVEKAGGAVTTRYYTPWAIKMIMKGLMDPVNSLQSRLISAKETEEGAQAAADEIMEERRRYKYRLPDPASRKDLEYYRDAARRGYLSHLVSEGEGPSLYFHPKTAEGKGKGIDMRKKRKESEREANRLW
ncbi:ribosomal protein L15 [Piedraia hortae CBS 480.64]|uniref:Ribosomal protein L15 n=1 Tax=Piedraia hortae CBS 480.64 TaxID=1314780 RepID=A0A6A7C6H1_9PEZI|nr:ribosomal protein L15 [Piedraia hortae CBS 480.64]